MNANATYYNSRSAISNHKKLDAKGAVVRENNQDVICNYWEAAANWRPNRYNPLIPISYLDPNAIQPHNALSSTTNIIDGKYFLAAGATDVDRNNIFADYYAAGKSTWTSRQFQFDAGVNVDLGSVLKGLSFHALVGVDYQTSYSTSYKNSYATFEPAWSNYNGPDLILSLDNHETVDKKSGQQDISGSTNHQMITFNAHFDYNRTFADKHNVSAMVVANGFQQTRSGQYHKVSNANLGLNLSYNYAHKYYVDFAVAAPWSAKLPEGKRAGFSPSATLGWNIAKEAFMEGSIFDNLTISASASSLKTDLDIENYYMYLGTIQQSGWWDWNGLTGHNDFAFKRGGNPDLAYIKRNEISASIHAELLERSLAIDASVFSSVMDGGIITASNQMPSYFKSYYPESSFLSYLNYNKDTRSGFDVAVKYKKNFGDFGFEGGANMTYYTTKASKRDDANYADTYQYREGKALDAIWGYECLGFFKDEADIANSPKQSLGATVKPGDLKYKDQNGRYAGSFDELIDFVKNGQKAQVYKQGEITDEQLSKGLTEQKALHFIAENLADSAAACGIADFEAFKANFKRDTSYVSVLSSIFPAGFNPDSLAFVPFAGGAKFELDTVTQSTKSGLPLPLFEARTPYTVYLNGLNHREIVNLCDEAKKTDKYPGLKVGDIVTPNNNAGNWE